ncbi:MAG: bifunctional chorismate mutase/prephenate dehydrogenase [Candidatus Obscuribacterales bacterium]|nr:bifunctional chorismate mutase/prephenate dehydrogenase [Candidatus Obscuribacterales bacterium]
MSHARHSNPIALFREQIDTIDANMIDLLEGRLRLAEKIGDAKRSRDLPIQDCTREEQILSLIRKRVQHSSAKTAIEAIYKEVFNQCRKNQRVNAPAITSGVGQFSTVAFVGLGLIGGALARQIRSRLPETKIVAYDSNGVPDNAIAEGVIDELRDDLLDAALECSLVILAATPEANVDNLLRLAPVLERGQLIIDVTSTKETICAVASKLPMKADFIGGHPMFGSEKSGYKNSKDVSVDEKSFLLTPTPHSSETSVKRLSNWISSIGLTPQITEAETHDTCLAITSHLVQLLMIALGNSLHSDDDDIETIAKRATLSGPSFRGLSRLMASPSKMWIEILQLNKRHVLNAIDRFQSELYDLRVAIANNDEKSIELQFETASRIHRALSK